MGNGVMPNGLSYRAHPRFHHCRRPRRDGNAPGASGLCRRATVPKRRGYSLLVRQTCEKPELPAFRVTLPSSECSWVIDGDGQMLGRLWGRGHQAHPVRRLQTVPCSLRDDGHHPRLERKRLRPVRGHDVQRRGAVDDLHDFVAVRVALPGAFSSAWP